MAVVPFTVMVPYWDIELGTVQNRIIHIGCTYDDDVHGSGGESDSLQNWLELIWQNAKRDWQRYNLLQNSETPDVILTDARGTFHVPLLRAIDINFLSVPQGVDFWWNSESFGKFGYISPISDVVFNNSQIWINFLRQRFTLNDVYDGFDILIHGGSILATAHFWSDFPMPPITFIGFNGFTGQYDDTGLTES